MDRENKYLQFVLKYYAPGRFDTRKALASYKSSHPAVKLSLWRPYVAGVAAMIAVCLLVGYYLMRGNDNPVVLYASDSTATYILPDSSEVTLSPHSSLSYVPSDFNDEARDVDMRGRVEFNVRRNPQAPFTVTASYASVRVLGTQFTVAELDGDSITEVSVTSGKVLFTAKGSAEGVVLTRGMEAGLLVGASKPVVMEDEATAPQTRRFVFDNAPLADVLKELSAHFKVELSCPTKGKTLTAEFESDDLDEIIMLIEKSLNVKIERTVKK